MTILRQNIVFYSELKAKESKVYQLEEAFKDLKAENMKGIETFTKDMHELQNTHKFVTEDLRLQLANAEVQLRDIDDFREQKTAIEHEIARQVLDMACNLLNSNLFILRSISSHSLFALSLLVTS